MERSSARSAIGVGCRRAVSSRRRGQHTRSHGPADGCPGHVSALASDALAARHPAEPLPRRARRNRRLLPAPPTPARGRNRVPGAVLARAALDRARLARRRRPPERRPAPARDQLDRRLAARLGPGLAVGRGRDHTAREPYGALSVFSLLVFIWASTGMMAALRTGLEAALQVERRRPAARAKLVDLVLVAGAGALLIVALALTVLAQVVTRFVGGFAEEVGLENGLFGELAGVVVPLVVTTVVVMLLYRFVPSRRLRFGDAVAGGIVTGLLLLAISAASALVLQNVSDLSVIYGSITVVLVFLYAVTSTPRRCCSGRRWRPHGRAERRARRADPPPADDAPSSACSSTRIRRLSRRRIPRLSRRGRPRGRRSSARRSSASAAGASARSGSGRRAPSSARCPAGGTGCPGG